jgi:sugar phosphate isomerase/epimerase
MTRREALKQTGLIAALMQVGWFESHAASRSSFLHIGACDWSIGKSSDITAFEVAHAIGLEGIQVNLGSLANNLHLRSTEMQQAYIRASKQHKVKISSLAIGELNQVPYKSDPRTDQWVSDSIDVAEALNVKTILLAFFVKNDLRNDVPGRQEVIRKLKVVAPKAEWAGVTLGIESYLTAEEHMDIIQQVGSPAIKVFYDFRNAADAGHDVIKEIKWLGKDIICELHIKENGYLLGQGTMDWQKIFETLHSIGYKGDGWMQIEWAFPEHANIISSYRSNLSYLKNISSKTS